MRSMFRAVLSFYRQNVPQRQSHFTSLDVQYQGVCGLGDQTHQGVHPFPPNQGMSPRSKIFWFPPKTDTFVPPDNKFPCSLCTISHYLYIFANRIIFYWISEQYTSLCCWLIQMFIHKPFSILPLEWTALLTVAWFPVSYRTQFMARRLSF